MSPKTAQKAEHPAKTEVTTQAPAVSLPESQTTTALALVAQSISELNKVAQEVASLEPRFKGVVFDVKTTAGMKAACEARLAIRRPRYAIQNMQKDAKTPLNALKKGIDDQVEAVIARITAIEGPIHEQISNEETRKENERKAREEAEAKRVATIHERIEQDIRQVAFAAVNRTSAQIEVLIIDVVAIAIDDSFAEFKQQAEGAKATTLIRLRAALANAQTMEAEAKRVADERAENERVRLENEAAAKVQREQLAEAQRIAKESFERERLRLEAAADIERARIADEERKAREARETEEAEFREQQRLHDMRMQELSGLRQQVYIATVGRLGVRAGGTRECIVDTLKETQEWSITEENFGKVLFGAAQKIKADVIAQIEQLLTQWDERQRLADENSALQTQRDAQAAEAQRLIDEGAELQRQQEALRAEREKPAIVTTISEGADIREDSVRQARDTPCDALSQPAEESISSQSDSDSLLASIDIKVYLAMEAVCKAAQTWATFQHPDSKTDQKTDRKLKARARDAEAYLLAVVEAMPGGAAA